MQLLLKSWLWFLIFLPFICKVGVRFASNRVFFIFPPLLTPHSTLWNLLQYQETHAPYMSPLARLFFQDQPVLIIHSNKLQISYLVCNPNVIPRSPIWSLLLVCRAPEPWSYWGKYWPAGPFGPGVCPKKHSLCCASCLEKFDGNQMLFVWEMTGL